MYDDAERPGNVLLLKKQAFNLALRIVGFHTTRLFTDLRTFLMLCPKNAPGPNNIELMTHPGSAPGSEEDRLLASDWTAHLSYQAALISYIIQEAMGVPLV